MGERRCRYCQKSFQTSKFQPRQEVCGTPDCQKRRRTDYHKEKIAADPEYRQVCLDSSHKWRSRNPGYWKHYREGHPAAPEQNREQQKVRDRRRRLRRLANNTSALDLKPCAAEVWLVGPEVVHLANNNSAPAHVWVIEALSLRKGTGSASCKQHPSGAAAAPAA